MRCNRYWKGIGEGTKPFLSISTVNNVTGIYRSTDKGITWLRMNDDAHQYGGPGNGQFVKGDMNVFGRVYMSTTGRGIVCGSVAAFPAPGSK